MSSICEGDEVFFDTSDCLVDSDYDIWLRMPNSVNERRDTFFATMGLVHRPKSDSSVAESFHDNLLSERRNSNSEANSSVGYINDHGWLDDTSIDLEEGTSKKHLNSLQQCGTNTDKKKATNWWRQFAARMKKNRGSSTCKESKAGATISRVRVEPNRKRCLECSVVYPGQEIKAHDGLIWTMKFSPDGQFLATGGADGVVCIWRVVTVAVFCNAGECAFDTLDAKKSVGASIVVPEKIFRIEEEPLQKLHGHGNDVLDLAWSNSSDHILSASMDKTVRLWRVGTDECRGVFRHSNYVTCVEFNPVDENQFISGCIDGKVRIWGICSRRVEDWVNVREVVTAVCYQPNGKGFVAGSVSGSCRFYGLSSSDSELQLTAEMNTRGRKRSSSYRITGIRFLKNDPGRVMVTSEDSKIRILDGVEVVRKYKGLAKSGSQMSASFTASGSHIVSVGDDSRVYLWSHEDSRIQTSKQVKSTRSCEHFFSEGVSVALPWSGSDIGSPSHVRQESLSRLRDSDRFSLANWFSMDGSTRASSTTWPEEKLPLWDSPSAENESQPSISCGGHFHGDAGSYVASETWGLVFVTGDRNGSIKTFHNYGLPVRL